MVVSDNAVYDAQAKVNYLRAELQRSLEQTSLFAMLTTKQLQKKLKEAKKDLTKLKHEATLRIQEQKRRK